MQIFSSIIVWIMNIAFIFVLGRFIISIIDVCKETMGYNETTLSKLKKALEKAKVTFFQIEPYIPLARDADRYRRKVNMTKIATGIMASILYAMVWTVNYLYGSSGLLKALFIIMTTLLLFYLYFDQTTGKKIKDKEHKIYNRMAQI